MQKFIKKSKKKKGGKNITVTEGIRHFGPERNLSHLISSAVINVEDARRVGPRAREGKGRVYSERGRPGELGRRSKRR